MKARDQVLRFLSDRAPNFVPMGILRNRLPDISFAELSAALGELTTRGDIVSEENPLALGDEPDPYFRLKDASKIPIRRSIMVGGVELPRVTSDSAAKFFPELYNEALEVLSEYTQSLEKRFQDIVSDQERRYWGKVSGIFAILVSVLALLLVGLPKIATNPSLSFGEVFWMNLAQVLPLAVVLALFILVLRWVVR